MAGRDMSWSGMAEHALVETVNAELKIRAQLALRMLTDILVRANTPCSDCLTHDMKAALTSFISQQVSALTDHLQLLVERMNPDWDSEAVRRAGDLYSRDMEARVDLWVLGLQNRRQPAEVGPTFNISGVPSERFRPVPDRRRQ